MQESPSLLERADLELLLAIRQHGSLAAAAIAADVHPSVVTKRLAALEARLAGHAPFNRWGDFYIITLRKKAGRE